ncbi:hypothetical protein EKO04_011304 [Ascochyta lentis]|uniref:Uncharacterized protein n=1 Tax=Ascochyta lentis TaxID=205686 RepID=A0A8H7IV05_9PLEO|nr:hypothetical protein EKO04_011304 [Ascochyta lentis]
MSITTKDYSSAYKPVLQVNEGEVEQEDHRNVPRLGQEPWWTKLVPLCILVPTCVSLFILTLHIRQYKDSGTLYGWSTSYRVLVQVFVHVLASVLGALWVFPTCTIISHWTRHRLSKKSVNLDTLRLWSAITQARADWNLPWAPAFATLAFLVLNSVPAVLWAGALTPAFTYSLTTNISLSVPSGGPNGDYAYLRPNLFLTNPIGDECWNTTQSNGTFTNCLKSLQTGNLLRSVATASSPDDRPRVHGKWDNTRFQFVGRSFGVGAAAGLTDRHIAALPNVQQYSYEEVGFHAETKCIYNESSALSIWHYEKPEYGTWPSSYLAYGALPNANWTGIMGHNYTRGDRTPEMDFYAQYAFGTNDWNHSIVSTFNSKPINDDVRWMFGMVAGIQYRQLNKTQYETIFVPSLFTVDGSIVNTTIKVTRVERAEVGDPDPTRNLRLVAADSYGLSFITNSLYTSTVGDSFMENIRNLQTNRSVWSDINDPSYKTVVLDAVADSVTSIMDDSLVALGSAALTLQDATQTVHATVKSSAVQIGSKQFVWAVVVINVLGLFGVITSYLVLWKAGVPTFEYSDIGCLVMGLVQGQVAVVEDGRVRGGGGMQRWDGNPDDQQIGCFAIRLQTNEKS